MADTMNLTLTEALGFMQRPIACPDDVKARIAALRVPLDDVTGTRITTNWRLSAAAPSLAPPAGSRWGRPSQDHRQGQGQGQDHRQGQRQGPRQAQGPRPPRPARPYLDRALAPRFGNKARADVTTEERMMDRIRDKMNKFSAMTYDATKAWLSQLLDSGETGFLTDFITLVFEKAAAEEPFCALYARLLTELSGDFPHLGVELRRIFGEFMSVFVEAAEEPDVGAAEYKAFLSLRARRSYRRGYAVFIGEVAKRDSLSVDDVVSTCTVILDGLMSAKEAEGKGLLCEEYADCLTSLMKSCKVLLAPVVPPLLARVTAAGVKSPSLTNKARFALMDIADLFV